MDCFVANFVEKKIRLIRPIGISSQQSGRGVPAAFRHLRPLARALARCASEVGRRRPG
ncbi:MAG: hypothetical protein ACOX9C_02520 [Kiritimatiellia bacterium]